MRTNNKLNPHMTLGPRFEPGPHWREVSVLTTAPSLHLGIQEFINILWFKSVHVGLKHTVPVHLFQRVIVFCLGAGI